MYMKMKSKILCAALALMAMLAGIGGFVVGRYYIDNKKPNFTKDYVLYVYPDTPMEQVLDSLCQGAGAVRPKSLERAFAKVDAEQNMKPGRYVIFTAKIPCVL